MVKRGQSIYDNRRVPSYEAWIFQNKCHVHVGHASDIDACMTLD